MHANYNNKLYKYQKLLLLLLPISLIFSIFIADLIVVILCIFFLYTVISKKKFQYFNNLYFKVFFGYWIYINLLSLFSNDLITSFKSSFPYIRFILLPLAIYYIIEGDKNFSKYFFVILIFLISALLLDSSYEFINGQNFFGYEKSLLEKGRLSSFFQGEFILGSYISKFFFIIAMLWFSIFDKNFKSNSIFIIFFGYSLLIVFLSGDRMPLLLFLMGSFIFLILSNLKFNFKMIFLFSIIVSFSTSIIFNQNLYDRLIKRTLWEIGVPSLTVNPYIVTINNDKKVKFLAQHQNFLYVSINMIKDKPIFGHSNKGYKISCENYRIDHSSCPSHPHNTYLQLLVENGFLGFIFFFSIFILITYILFRQLLAVFNKRNFLTDSQLCILICIYINLWPIAQTGNFFNNWTSIMYYLPVGFLIKEFNLIKHN